MAFKKLRESAKAAKGGDKEAFGTAVLEGPPGLKGKAPKDYVDSMADDEGFASEVEDEMPEEDDGESFDMEADAATTCVKDALTEHGVDAGEVDSIADAVVAKLREDGYLS